LYDKIIKALRDKLEKNFKEIINFLDEKSTWYTSSTMII
jgi:hypothetical protein